MSQFLLDEQLAAHDVLEPLRKRLKLRRLKDLRPAEQILDERIPELLRTLKHPTFLTLDHDFWNASWCHPDYAIIYFALTDREQDALPKLLLALSRMSEFGTRRSRMGKVIRLSKSEIRFWQFTSDELHRLDWPQRAKRRRDH